MFHNFGPTDLLLIAAVTMVLSGRGKASPFMGDRGSGICAFKKAIREGERPGAGDISACRPAPRPEPGA